MMIVPIQTADKIQVALLGVQICVGLIQAITTCFSFVAWESLNGRKMNAREQIHSNDARAIGYGDIATVYRALSERSAAEKATC
jgi:hypothetical protein